MKKSKRYISFLLAVVMLLTSVPGQVFAEGEAIPQVLSETEGVQEGGNPGIFSREGSSGNTTTYYEVKFQMPEDLAWVEDVSKEMEEEAAAEAETETEPAAAAEENQTGDEEDTSLFDLPEPMLLKEGTLISTIPNPKVFGYVFLGWYYDKELQLKASSMDVIERNITLYPKFGPAVDKDGNVAVDYVSEQDVAVDYPMLLASFGLSEEEIRERLVLRDFGSTEDEMEYTLIRREPDLKLLLSDEEKCSEVQEILDQYLNGEEDPWQMDFGDEALEESLVPEEPAGGEEAADESAADGMAEESAEELTEAEEMTEEELPEMPVPRWERPDGTSFEATAGYETVLADRLFSAGLSDRQVRSLLYYYAPEELELLNEEVFREVLEPLGFHGYYSVEGAIQTLRDTFQDEKELRAFLEEVFEPDSETETENLTEAWEEESEMEAGAPEAMSEAGDSSAAPAEADGDGAVDIQWLVDTYLGRSSADLYPQIYQILPASGAWKEGVTQQAEILDTENLRFFKDGEVTETYVFYYNIVVAKENYNNLRLGTGVLDILVDEVEGIDLENGGLVNLTMNEYGDMEALKNDRSGIMTYHGDLDLTVGSVACVHAQGYGFEQSFGAMSECPVTYIKITEDLGGGSYAYIMPEAEEVLFSPDNLVVFNDGSYEDGEILVPYDQLDFSDPMYAQFGIDENTVIEPGDMVTVITLNEEDRDNSSLAGYGLIRGVRETADGLQISYDPVSEAELEKAWGYSGREENVPVDLTDEEVQKLADEAIEELEEKDAISDVQNYISALILAEDYELKNTEYADMINEIRFQTDDGGEMTLEEVRALAEDFEWDKDGPKLKIQISPTLKHFHGTGFRLAVSYSITGEVDSGQKGKIVVTGGVQFEVELAYGVSADYWTYWDSFKVCGVKVKYPRGWIIYAAVDNGFFIGLGVSLTVQTKAKPASPKPNIENKPFMSGEATNKWMGKLQSANDLLDEVNYYSTMVTEGVAAENGEPTDMYASNYGIDASVGGKDVHNAKVKYYRKYKDFLNGGAQFIPILEKPLLPQTRVWTCGICEVTIGIKFKLSWKLNVMIGASLSFGYCKQSSVTIDLVIGKYKKKTSEADLEKPNFTLDFYIFGEIGIKATVEVDFRVGIISTALDSVGLVIEIGVQAVLYGFFYLSLQWVSGEGWDFDVVGSFLVEVDLIASMGLKAQIFNDAHKAEVKFLTVKQPLLTLGNEQVFVEMQEAEEDKTFDLELDSRTSRKKLEDNTLTVMSMSMNSGLTADNNMDSDEVYDGKHKSFTALGGTFQQKDEAFFDITVTDTDKDGKSLKHETPSWLYDPVTDMVYAKPHSASDGELWGEITFTFHKKATPKSGALWANYGNGFGLDKSGIERKIRVHWKGIPASIQADIHLQKDPFVGVNNVADLAQASAQVFDSLYERKDSMNVGDAFVGLPVTVSADGKAFQYDPNYELAFITEPYGEEVAKVYQENAPAYNSGKAANNTRLDMFKNTGSLWVLPEDQEHTFLAKDEKNRVSLYYNRIKLDSNWLLLDAKSENQINYGTEYRQVPKGEKIMDYMPSAIREAIAEVEEGKEMICDVYMVLEKQMTSVARKWLDEGMRAWNYPTLLPPRSVWTKVTEDTITPDENYYVFVEFRPNTKKVTWMYEGAERVTFVKPGDPVKPPYAGNKTGYIVEYWADENGERHETMPDHDLVLYPHYLGKEHTISWRYDGEVKATKIRVGESILSACPYEQLTKDHWTDEMEVRWRVGSLERGKIILAEDSMPDQNLILFGSWIRYRPVTWKMGEEVLAATREVVGDVLVLQEPELEKGKVCRWLKDGALLPEGYRMPDEALTLEALIFDRDHEHDWQEVGTHEAPTCMKASERHVKCSVCLEEMDEKLPVDPDAHDWGEVTYIWGEDNDTCTAKHVCLRNPKHFEVEEVRVRARIIQEAECEKDGTASLEALFENPSFEVQTKEETLKATGHVEGKKEKTNERAATCTSEGSYDEVTYCDVCGKTMKTEHVTVPKLEHVPGEAVHEKEKEATCKAEGSYEEVVKCTLCQKELQRETKTVPKKEHTPAAAVKEKEVKADCTKDGSYDEVIYCSACKTELQRKTVTLPKTGHTPSDQPVKENEVAPTCTKQGSYDEVIYCKICHAELSRETKTTEKAGHTGAEPVKENETEPTCGEEGSYELVTYCSVCGEELSREKKTSEKQDNHTPGKAVQENYVEATCQKTGGYDMVTYCTVCGQVVSTRHWTIAKTAHAAGPIVHENVVESSCTKKGSYDEVVYCEKCKAEMRRKARVMPMKEHTPADPVREDIKEATCTKKGSYDEVVYCSECGYRISHKKVKVPATGHVPLAEAVKENEIAAPCTKDGSYDLVTYCEVCGEEVDRETVTEKAPGHKGGSVVIENAEEGLCEKGGSYEEVVYCSVCGEELSREGKTDEAPGHKAGEAVQEKVKEPTCTADGSCEEVVYCQVCKEELSRQKKVLPATGHTPKGAVKEKEVAPTCTKEGGYDEVVYCAICDAEISREAKTIPATGHTPKEEAVIEKEVAATCIKDGSYDSVVYCSVCGGEVIRETIVIPATGHTPKEAVVENRVEPACIKEGSYDSVVYCSVCEAEVSREKKVIPAAGHTPKEAVVEKRVEPTCTAEGSYDSVVYCAVCEAEISRKPEVIPAAGHKEKDPVEENRVEPTCTAEGSYDEVVYCSVCEEEIRRRPQTIPATGHTPEDPVEENRVEPTCTVDGSYDEVVYCSVCSDEISRQAHIIPATGHTQDDPVEENKVEATCTENGSYDSVVYCSVCKEELSREKKTIQAPGHDPDEAVTENETLATCTSEGSIDDVVYCSVCGVELSRETRKLDPLPHTPGNPEKKNEVPATCQLEGSYDEVVYCIVCNTELSREKKYVAVTDDHVPGEPVRENELKATCEDDGFYDEVTYCEVCDKELSRVPVEVPATGHAFGEEVFVEGIAPSCTVPGINVMKRVCANEGCDKELYTYSIGERALGHDWAENGQMTGAVPHINDGKCAGWAAGTGDMTCKRCGYHALRFYPEQSIELGFDGVSYDTRNRVLTIDNPGLLSLFSSPDAVLNDLFINAYAHTGNIGDDFYYYEVAGTFTIDGGAEVKLNDIRGSTRMYNGHFTPVDTTNYGFTDFVILITVP